MSVVTIQVGQCGNQVGYDWYTRLGREVCSEALEKHMHKKHSYIRESFERWFNSVDDEQRIFARAVLIDTEQKVINSVFKKASRQMWQYNPASVVCRKDGGSGNNWALGFCERGPEMQEAVLNSVRKEVEACDRLCTFHNLLSCAGGTGSGLGSRIIADLRDEYQSKFNINSLVFPYNGGEIITQNYNLIFTLSEIYDVSDVNIVFQNDDLHKTCTNLYGNSNVDLHDLNSLISVKLLSCLQPVYSRSRNYLPSLISAMSPHPCYKLVSVKSAPHTIPENPIQDTSVSWNALLKYMMRSLYLYAPKGDVYDLKSRDTKYSSVCPKYLKSIANVLITRGGKNIPSTNMKDFCNKDLYPDWIPVASGFQHFHQEEKLLDYNKFVSLISNNSSVYECLNIVVEKAWTQFAQKAYLHQFTKHGLEENDIAEAFVKIENILTNYKHLSAI
ncbi:hypothetical protein R5R35_008619 [Gryllus longicercus]|uniref:Tubulin delta chain n=1 Tax=Gryllus longicercus TaxID=2509291 RepID=A0AAN9ZAF1_9ORTH